MAQSTTGEELAFLLSTDWNEITDTYEILFSIYSFYRTTSGRILWFTVQILTNWRFFVYHYENCWTIWYCKYDNPLLRIPLKNSTDNILQKIWLIEYFQFNTDIMLIFSVLKYKSLSKIWLIFLNPSLRKFTNILLNSFLVITKQTDDVIFGWKSVYRSVFGETPWELIHNVPTNWLFLVCHWRMLKIWQIGSSEFIPRKVDSRYLAANLIDWLISVYHGNKRQIICCWKSDKLTRFSLSLKKFRDNIL